MHRGLNFTRLEISHLVCSLSGRRTAVTKGQLTIFTARPIPLRRKIHWSGITYPAIPSDCQPKPNKPAFSLASLVHKCGPVQQGL